MTFVGHHRDSCAFDHQAFIYDSDEGYTAVLRPLFEEARASGDTLMAVVPRHRARLIRRDLDGRDDGIEFVAAEAWYENPVATIAGYDAILRGLPVGTRAFVVGEVQFGDSESSWAAWTRYESALNQVMHMHNARVVCPYDARALPASVVDDARRTHPFVLTETEAGPSADYADPAALLRALPLAATVPSAAPDIDIHLVGPADLRTARHRFAEHARARGLATERVGELSVAVSEVLTNAMAHGGGRARLRVWSEGRAELTCVVDDDGPGINDPLLGYVAPGVGAPAGYGTWLARRLFERAEFLPSPTGGLTVVLSGRA